MRILVPFTGVLSHMYTVIHKNVALNFCPHLRQLLTYFHNHTIANCLPSVPVKEFWKSANNWQIYRQK